MFYMFFPVLSSTPLFKAQLSKSWITANFDCNVITVLCKKHVEDDITRKLANLGLNNMKMEVSKDIFRSDKE